MVSNMTTIRQHFTGEWAALRQPEAMLAACGEVGYPGWRDRILTPVTTMQRFLWQMLPGNTACSHLPHLSGIRFSAVADGHARARRPRRFFDRLLERCGRAGPHAALDDGRWPGHRTCLVDGSGGSMPDTPALQEAFAQSTAQRAGGGFPVAHLLGLFHVGTGMLLTRVVAPLLPHDLAQGQRCTPCSPPVMGSWRIGGGVPRRLSPGSCRPACRPYSASARDRSWPPPQDGRVSNRVCGGHQPSKASHALVGWRRGGGPEQRVAWLKPTTCPSWLTRETCAARPEAFARRQGRDGIGRPGFRTRQVPLGTTLRAAEPCRVADLAALYRQRWQVERSRAHLKPTLPMDVLPGHTVPGGLKAWPVFALVYNLVRMSMGRAATLPRLGVERLSVVEALRWLGALGTRGP
jgi:hypothetical protein